MNNIKNKIFHKIIYIFIFMILIIFMTSCIPIVELNKRGLIQSIGIDYNNDIFEVSVQMFNSTSSTDQKKLEASSSNSIVTATGTTIMDAMKRTSLKQDRQIYYKVTNTIILGRSIFEDKKIFKQTIDFLNHTYMSSPSVYIAMADKKASDIISTEIAKSDLPSNFIQDILKNVEAQGYTQKIFLSNLVTSLNSFNTSTSIPIIKKQKSKDQEKKDELAIKGIGVISNGKLTGEINANQVKFIRLLDDQKSSLSFNLSSKKYGKCEFNIIKKRCDIKHEIVNNIPYFYIYLNIESILMENDQGYNIRNLSEQDIINLETILNYYFRKNISKILNKNLKSYNSDLLYFTDDIYRSNYKFLQQNKNNWVDVLSHVNVSIKIRSHISRSFMEESKS